MTPSFALEQRRVEDGEAQESPKDDNVGFALIRNSSPILNEYKEPFLGPRGPHGIPPLVRPLVR